MFFITQQKRTAPPGVDAAETVDFLKESGWPLSFRKSTVVASIRVRGGQSFLRGLYDTPTLRAMYSIHKCVAKDAPHLFH